MNDTPKHMDYAILAMTLLLMAIGVMMVYSTSAILASERYGDVYYFLKRELLFTGLGLGLMFSFKSLDYHHYYKLTYPILFFCFILLLLVFIPGLGYEVNGAKRWIRIAGFGLQPSEVSKFGVLLFLAYALAKKGEAIKNFKTGFLPTLAVPAFIAAVVLYQEDLGTAVVIALITGLLLFVGGARWLHLGACALATLPVIGLAIFLTPFRVKRLLAFLDPWAHRADTGFQIIQSYVAFNSGGLSGAGLGQGKQKLFYLPEAHTDFIFSGLAEELGLIGSLAVIGLFFFLIFRGIRVAFRAPDLYGTYLALGITSLLSVQALMNFAVVMGLMPTKGLPLPFISHGGTALLIFSSLMGILLNISSQTLKK
ncbi:MAG: putative lipid II flippase FtsW [Deltaproteobacteria bacterium]|nr:putative lipid II flippase FtsW [Deltaproteobacteria bacterium]